MNPRFFCDLFKLLITGLPSPIGISIDITNKCNLKCKHCYFQRENYKEELDDGAWMNKLKSIKKRYKSILQASWCGGEPLLRKELVEKGIKLFRYNIIITNGILPLPKWPDCVFKVSVDGTKQFHEEIRGNGTYDKIKQNINRKDIKIEIACILNRLNYRSIREMINEWSKTYVRGIHFGFYSPTKRETCDDLRIDLETRDEIIEELRLLKREYGKFILVTDKILDLMLSKNCKNVTSNCPFRDYIICLDPLGIQKLCPVGSQRVCEECGHLPPFFIKAIKSRDIETLKFLYHQII